MTMNFNIGITGKSGSGKSTALHNLLANLLLDEWEKVILLDGKGSELVNYAHLDTVVYYGPEQLAEWAITLERYAMGMPPRYASLVARELREALPTDARTLIVIDEVQKGTNAKEIGTAIKNSLDLITEQNRALHDMLIISTQRDIKAIPPTTRENISIWLSLLGLGYFHLKPDGTKRTSGRTRLIGPNEALAHIASNAKLIPFSVDTMNRILGALPSVPGRALVTMYVGDAGSGRTFHLRAHPVRYKRIIFLDCEQPHKKLVESAIEEGHGIAPPKATITDLIEIACLAIQAIPSLVLIDNVKSLSAPYLRTILRLIEVSAEVAMAANSNALIGGNNQLDHLVSRATIVEIQPLSSDEARALIDTHMPVDILQREVAIKHIMRMAKGHPLTCVNLAMQVNKGTLAEVRQFVAPHTRTEPVNLIWVPFLIGFFAFIYYSSTEYAIAAGIMVAAYIIRRRMMRVMRKM